MNNLIYVIIPVYNCVNYLENAVNSILSQPYKNIRIVLVDDGSTDGSGELCDKISNNKFIDVIHTNNGGVSSARNLGIQYTLENATEGDYFAFLDADDMWVSNALSEDILKKFSDFEIIGFGTYLSNSLCTRYKIESVYSDKIENMPKRADTRWMFKGHFGAHLYSCNLIKNYNIRFLKDVKLNEDIIFIRQAFFAANSAVFLEKMLYVYRQNNNSVMHNNNINLSNALDIANAWDKIRYWCETTNKFKIEQCKIWHERCDAAVGMRVLEAVRRLAENGYSENDISKVTKSSNLYICLENIELRELASWQKDDLKLYRENYSKFIKLCKKEGKRTKLVRKIKNNIILRYFFENRIYRIKDI